METPEAEEPDVPAPEIDPEPVVIEDSEDERQRQEELARRIRETEGAD
jgi:hypothetical protein